MKRLSLLLSVVVLLASRGAWASVVDAPHNETNGVKCSSCHSYSLWWQYSPTNLNASPDHATIVDAVCLTCHGPTGTEPKVKTHSAAAMGTNLHGDFGVGCVTCHNPHYQDQLNWTGSASEPYLVTGVIDSVSYNGIDDQTTISYSAATANGNWPAEGGTSTEPDWANKSVSLANPGRGLILVHDTVATSNTFLIVSATPTQVVFKGVLDFNAIDPNYADPQTLVQNSATANTFGLIYGQLVRDSIATKPVKFFDPNGGFVEAGVNTTGICQVCHTLTKYFTNTGDLPVSGESHIGRQITNCSGCHAHDEGFKGGGTHDNTAFAWDGNCATCHNANSQVANIVSDLHGASCGICHLSAAGGGVRIDGNSLNGTDGSAIGGTNNSNCVDCHLTTLTLLSKNIHHVSKNGYAAVGNCTQCHQAGTGTLAADHSAKVGTDASCVSCHTLTAGTVAGVAVDGTDAKIHDACTTCHNTDGTLKGLYGKASAMPAGGGNCTACHGVYFPTHTHGHTFTTVAICLNCHVAAAAPFAATGEAHTNGCTTCHNGATGVLSGSAAGKMAGANCQDCHNGYFNGHGHSHVMATVPLCVSCHTTATNAPFVASGQTHSRLTCLTCHSATTGALIGSATGMKGVADLDCQSCHSSYFNGHAKDHSALVKTNTDTTVQVTNCTNCHAAISPPFIDVANGEAHSPLGCQTCHSVANGSLLNSAAPRGVEAAVGGECADCHTAYLGGHGVTHTVVEQGADLAQAAGTQCSVCHVISGWTPILTLHNGLCSTCHNADRLTANPNNAAETVKDVIAAKASPTACLACHWAKKTPLTHGHNIVWTPANQTSCGVSSCHNAALNTEVVALVHGNNCALCHVDPTAGDFTRRAGTDGTALGQVLVTPASCADCHSPATYPTGAVHHDSAVALNGNCTTCHSGASYGGDHTTLVVSDPTCSTASCHPGTAGTASGVPLDGLDNKIHDQCTTCHETSGLLKAAYGKAIAMPDGGVGSDNGGGSCTACHGAYFPNHSNANHSTRVVGSGNCNLCHLTASIVGTNSGIPVAPADNKVHDECLICHDANGALRTAYGEVSVIPAGGGVCEACHGAYFANHANANHTTKVGDTANCNTCHAATVGTATGVSVDAVDNKVHDGCAVCHNSNGSLRTAYGKASAIPTGGGTCNACHGAYFINHVKADHTARVAPATSCTSCHTATAGTSTSVPLSTTNAKVHDACGTCHNITNGALLAAYSKAPTMASPGGACEACHGAYVNKHTHAHTLPTVALCLNCHTATSAPYAVSGQAHARLGCQTCHNATTGLLSGSAVGKVSGATCLTCHSVYFNGHSHSHEMVTVPLCVSCHTTATTAPYVAAGQTHVRLGCQTCHSGTTGLRFGSAAGKAKGATCQTCHSTYFNGHTHNHATKMTANVATTPYTANCKGCHSATTAPFVATGQAHTRLGCLTCHNTASNGALIGSAFGKTGVKECITCHSAYFAGHQQHSGTTHDVLMRGTDLSDGAACNICHIRGGSSTTNPLFVNSWSGTEGIFALHRNDCTLCHNSTRTANVGIGFTSVNNVIRTGVTVACLNCHTNRAVGHGGHNEGDGTFTWISACQTCHGIGGTSLSAPQGEIMADVHSNSCAKCHQGGVPGAILIGPAVSATWGVKPHVCTECHVAGFNGHSHGSTHTVAMGAADLVNNGAACNECHKRGGTSVTNPNPLFTNTWSGTDGILALHNNSCTLCHSSTRTTNLSPSFTSVSEVIRAHTTTVNCLDCHANRASNHSSHDAADFTWAGSCNTCHTGANIAINVHKGKCYLCHIDPNGGGTKRAGSDGDANLAEALPEGTHRTASCLTCHPVVTYPTSGIHHDSRTAATNDCQTCHKAINHSTFVTNVSPCSTCHMTTAGTTTGMPTDMANARVHDSCRSCHAFNATTLAGQLVAPTGKKGVTTMAQGSCTTCHSNTTTMHHNSGHAKIGECEYCHADPRNRLNGTNFQETNPAGGIPTHLPCEECHVKPKRGATVNGWTATPGQMTIYAYNEAGTHSTTNYSSDFTRTVANSGTHVVGNTVGQINNWGICFSCHDGSGTAGKAVRVNIFHAKPTTFTASRSSCGSTGDAAFAPGREARNTIGNFDFFASTFRPRSTKPSGSGDCKQASDWQGSVKYGSTNFPASDLVVPDPWSLTSYTVPMFAGQVRNTTVTPSADNVKVTSAVWNGANILVSAKNTNGCAALTATYNGKNQAFVGTGICTATFPQTVEYTVTVPTLNVTTTNVEGFNVTGYRITDATLSGIGHVEGDGSFIWESTCLNCHGVGTDSLAAPNGEIIDGIHSGNCGLCHQGGVGGSPLIGSAIPAATTAKPHSCNECHVGYFDAHQQGNNLNGKLHEVSMRPVDLSAGAACNTCHKRGGTTSANPLLTNTWTGTDGIKAIHQLGCGECHNSTRTTKIGGGYTSVFNVIMTGINVGCLDCHANRSAYHGRHFEGDGSFEWVAQCQECHATGSPSTEVQHKGEIIDGVHAAGCGLCHQNGTGGATLIGSATNSDMSPRPHYCTDCHSAYFDAHQRGATHDVLMRVEDKSAGSPCNYCHKVGGTGSVTPLFANTWAGANGIRALHQHGCENCHKSDRTFNVSAGFTSIQDVILRGTQIGCHNCHDNRVAEHGLHADGDGTFIWESLCETCHGVGSISDHAPFGEIIRDVHVDTCTNCHLGGVGGGTFIGSAANVAYGLRPHPCTECHVGGFDTHLRGQGANHLMAMQPTDLSLGYACNTCHRRESTSSTNPLFLNQVDGTDGIMALHQGGCAQCHQSTRTRNVKAPYTSVNALIMAMDATGETPGCLDCHADRINGHGDHKTTDFVWDGNCNTCHTGSSIVVSVHKSNCGLCHVAPAGAGTLRAGTNGSALLVAPSGLKRLATCLTCHPALTYPKDKIHHGSPSAVTNNCAICHATSNHSALVSGTGTTCITCHAANVGMAAGAPVSTTDAKVHDACRTCHTFDANLKGILVAPTNKRGVTAMPAGGTASNDGGGVCTVCHTLKSSSIHHGNAHAKIGECEWCHADPRNKSGGTLFQETNPAGGIPTHLPCEECHVTPKRGATVNGWTANAGQMTIYAYNESAVHSTTNYSSDFVRTVANSGGHVISNTVGKINNWGICFSCHDGSGAAGKGQRVNLFHSKPTSLTATRDSCGDSGTARYAPGREERNSIGNFDFFASTFRPNATKVSSGSNNCGKGTGATSDWTNAVKYGSTIFAATDLVIPDPWSAATIAVPMFAAQVKGTTTTPSADNVQVSSAIWNGLNIVVTATNTSGCAALTAIYNGNSKTFTGTGTCAATFASSVVYTSSVPNLNVTTTNVEGLGVTGYRITDGTLSLGSHSEGDGNFAWISNCATCHGVSSTSTAAPRGEIIADIHSGNCGLCHQNGIAAATLIGSATRATVGAKPHVCTECHTGYFASHLHGTGTNHAVLMRGTDLAGTAACNTCHKRGGTKSTNPLFVNMWSGTDGINALHQQGCVQCHNSTRAYNVKAPYTSVKNVIMTGITVSCNDCHASRANAHSVHTAADFVWAGTCNTCHTGANIVVNVHKDKCGACHVNPAGAGALRAGANGSGILGVSSGLLRSSTCLTCHPTTTYPAGAIHHDTVPAVNNNCTTCHTTVDHSLKVEGTGTLCLTCHTATEGIASGVPVNMADAKVHDACRTCHTFDLNLRGTLVSPTNKRGVTAMPAGGGVCTACHTSSTGIHHNNAHALIGECEYCHADPRNMEGRIDFQETDPAGGIPTHLPCEECHVTPKRGVVANGWTAAVGQMTIYAFNEGGSHSTTNYSTDFVRSVANNGGHVIGNTVGKINNWGICFSCHDGSGAAGKAQRVNIFHAKPTTFTATQSSCGTNGTAAFAPGREVRNSIGNFDFFASTFRPNSTKPGGSGSCKQASDWSASVKYGSTIFTASDLVIPDPFSAATYTVPMFAAQTQNTTTTPAADNVKVTSAIWNGTNLVVIATNTSGCAALTANYNGNNQSFTGTTTCTATFGAGVLYSSSMPTVNVTTTNAEGLGVTGYRVVNTAVQAPALAIQDSFSVAGSGVTNLLVMANDTGAGIAITNITQPALGSVAILDGTSINYTGAGVGSTSFTYTISAIGGTTSTTTVNLTMSGDATPPTHTGTLSATAVSASQVNLGWPAATDSGSGMHSTTPYKVVRANGATAPANCSGTAIYTGTALTFNNTGLTESTQYSYRVCAYDAVNNATSGLTATVTTPALAATLPTLLGTPAFTTGGSITDPITLAGFTAPAGTNRVLIIYAGSENTTAPVVTVANSTFNGLKPTTISQQTNGRDSQWFGYIPLGTGTAITSTISIDWSAASANGYLWAAVYENAAQVQTLSWAATSTTNALTSTINTPDSARVIYATHWNGADTSGSFLTSPTTNTWTRYVEDDAAGGWHCGIEARNETTANAALAVNPANAGATSNRSNLLVIAVQKF